MKQRLVKEERSESKLVVFIKVKQLTKYITRVAAGCDVKYRYSLLNKLLNECYDMLHFLFEANDLKVDNPDRVKLIRQSIARLKTIEFITSLASEVKCFTKHQEEVILMYSGDCYKYMEGYLKYSNDTLVI